MTIKHIDYEVLNEVRDVMEDEFEILITTFISDAENRIEKLRIASNDKKSKDFALNGHGLKGSAANVGADVLSSFCLNAEKIGKSGDMSNSLELLNSIEKEFSIIKEILIKEIS